MSVWGSDLVALGQASRERSRLSRASRSITVFSEPVKRPLTSMSLKSGGTQQPTRRQQINEECFSSVYTWIDGNIDFMNR